VALGLGAGIVAAVAVSMAYLPLFAPATAVTPEQLQQSIDQALATTTIPPAFSAEVYETILPSLVFIRTALAGDGTGRQGVGSGVIVSAEGAILTAHHVVAGASVIDVVFYDGTETGARVVAAEPENDIAVLQADGGPEVTVPAVLGSAGGLRVGDEAYAVGNPLGLAGSMTAGVISGFDRSAPRADAGGSLDGLIQFDTAVNPGSSGGPLLNRHGQVVGIVTALANPADLDYFVGIGFAVPISVASSAAGGPPQ
jgi:S1-C subfamily serine protease